MASTIQEHIAALREEVERQYKERLTAIAALEANLLGSSNGSIAAPTAPPDPAIPLTGMFANIVRVRRALSPTEFRTIRELTRATDLDEFAVRNALKSKTLLREIERKKDGGGPLAYRLRDPMAAPKIKRVNDGESVQDIIRDVLASHSGGATSTEIVDAVIPRRKTTAANPRNPVLAMICKMKQRGSLSYDEKTKLYRLTKSK